MDKGKVRAAFLGSELIQGTESEETFLRDRRIQTGTRITSGLLLHGAGAPGPPPQTNLTGQLNALDREIGELEQVAHKMIDALVPVIRQGVPIEENSPTPVASSPLAEAARSLLLRVVAVRQTIETLTAFLDV